MLLVTATENAGREHRYQPASWAAACPHAKQGLSLNWRAARNNYLCLCIVKANGLQNVVKNVDSYKHFCCFIEHF